MKSYVQDRNGARTGNAHGVKKSGSLDHLKMKPPQVANASNTSQSRAQSAHVRLTAATASPGGAFYGTDASSIDRSSGTANALAEDQQYDEDAEGEELDFSSGDELPAQPGNGLLGKLSDDKQERLRQNMHAQKAHARQDHQDVDRVQAMGYALGHLNGDTPPSSTSGPPSHVTIPQAGTQSTTQVRGRLGTQDEVPIRSSVMQFKHGHGHGHNHAPSQSQDDRQQSSAAGQRQVPMTSRVQERDIADDFQFAKPPVPKSTNMKRPDQGRFQAPQQLVKPQPPASQPVARKLDDHWPPPNIAPPAQSHVPTQRLPAPAPVNTQASIAYRSETKSARPKHDGHARSLEQRPRLETPSVHQSYQDQANDENNTPSELEYEHEEEIQARLDHLDFEPQIIRNMNYKELKSQNFDTDPRAPKMEDMPLGSLADKLVSFSNASSEEQRTFCGSLNIEQWEEAGDWFLERFGDVVKKVKTARQEKRKAARAFEDEIEQRHDAVAKKRKTADNALQSMQQSGLLVLAKANTPKKGKKTK